MRRLIGNQKPDRGPARDSSKIYRKGPSSSPLARKSASSRKFGTARKLTDRLAEQLKASFESLRSQIQEGKLETPCRTFTEFEYSTLESWSRARRVIGKAEILAQGDNPRFIVTNLPKKGWGASAQAARFEPAALYEKFYCARGDMENRVKEQQLDLFADRTSTHRMASKQLRLWF